VREDHEAEFVEFARAKLPWLRRLAYVLTQDVHAADDIVQATLTKLYLHWRTVRIAENLDAYVRVVPVWPCWTRRPSRSIRCQLVWQSGRDRRGKRGLGVRRTPVRWRTPGDVHAHTHPGRRLGGRSVWRRIALN
jgi:hypothetical protein